jgi:hypothetical protein
MLILLDQSGSMGEAQGSSTRWDLVTGALRTFVQAPESAGIGVGIAYFPLAAPQVTCVGPDNPPGCLCFGVCPGAGCTCVYNGSGASCVVADYATPDVPIQPLPGVAPDIVASLAGHGPGGGTPTFPALQGALQYTTAYAAANASHKVVVVLATDGAPNDCNSTVTNVAQVAAAGLANAPSIQTFVIGIGNVGNLDMIAQAGGTGRAFLVDAAAQGLLDAMNTIRGSVAGCSLQIPMPTAGAVIDFSLVEVRYTPAGGATEIVPRVMSGAECNSTTGGWHYDDASQPHTIELCPATCDRVRVAGSLSVAVGCS